MLKGVRSICIQSSRWEISFQFISYLIIRIVTKLTFVTTLDSFLRFSLTKTIVSRILFLLKYTNPMCCTNLSLSPTCSVPLVSLLTFFLKFFIWFCRLEWDQSCTSFIMEQTSLSVQVWMLCQSWFQLFQVRVIALFDFPECEWFFTEQKDGVRHKEICHRFGSHFFSSN